MGKWEMVRLGDVCEGKSSNIAQKDLEQNEGDYPIFGASGLIKHVDFYRHDFEYIAVVKDGAGVGRTTLCPPKSSIIGTMQAILPKPSVNSRYLYYAISGMNLASYYTGATIPHIYFKDYSKEMLTLPPLPVQQQIADVLDRASALIEKRKAQIEKLDLLVKSQFIEMFGNRGYDSKPLSDIAVVMGGLTKNSGQKVQGKSYPFLRVANVYSNNFDLTEMHNITVEDNKVNRVLLNKGDLLFVEGNGSPTQIGRVAIWDGQIQPCVHQNHLIKVRFVQKINPMYAMYYFMSPLGRKQIVRLASSTSGLYTLNLKKIGSLELPIPPLALQTEFANFVQTVEAQKSLLQQSLAKLEQNYKSLIQKCFRGEIF